MLCRARPAQARAPRLLTPRAPDPSSASARRLPLSVAISNDRVAVAASPPHRAPAPSDEAAREGAPRMLPGGGTRRSTWHRGSIEARARVVSHYCARAHLGMHVRGRAGCMPEFRRRRGRWSERVPGCQCSLRPGRHRARVPYGRGDAGGCSRTLRSPAGRLVIFSARSGGRGGWAAHSAFLCVVNRAAVHGGK